MAILQKTDSQFRQKEYKLKLAEIIPLPGQSEKPSKHDAIEEELPNTNTGEVNDEFLINNLKTEANDLIYDMASKIMKASFEEIYQHPIDLKRFLEEYEYEDQDVIASR